MGHVSKDRCRPWLLGAVAALAFAGAAVADTTPPQLINLSVFPQSADTSAGPAVLALSITALDAGNGFNSNAAGNGSITLALAGGTTVISRQGLPITGGTSVNPVFQFTLTLPQSSPAGVYSISLILVDNASNVAIFTAANLAALGFPSSIAVTESALGSVTLSASTVNVPAPGASGSVGVTASNSGFAWSASSNAPWLTVVSGAFGTGNGAVGYSAAANGSPASRTGVITISGQTFTVIQAGAGSVLNTTQSSLQFSYQVNGAFPQPQTLTVFSSGTPLNFTATASSAGNWLFVSPASGLTPTVLSIFVNPGGLSPGTYSGAVAVTAAGSSNGSQTVTVTLIVSGSPLVAISPSSLFFSFQQGGAIPASQTLSVSAAAATAIGASASSVGNWLAVSPSSSTTPSTLSVSVAPTGLAAGTYSGEVAITTPGGVQNVAVTLVVSTASSIAVNPGSLTFSYAVNGSLPASQALAVSGGTTGLSFSATASSTGNWLTLGTATGTIPGAIGVSVNPSGLAVGTYFGAVTLTPAGLAPQSVPVTLIVSAAASFTVSPGALNFSVQLGSTLLAMQSLTIVSSQPNASFTATAQTASGSPAWLSTGVQGSFPAGVFEVIVNPANLIAGMYSGAIIVNGGGASQSVPVTLVVGNAPVLTITPSVLAFAFLPGGATPASQTVIVDLNGGPLNLGITPSSAGGWLSVTEVNTSTSVVLTVSVNPSGLAAGTYNGSVGLSLAPFTTLQNLPVTLTVGGGGSGGGSRSFTASPTSFQVNYQVGDPNPNGQVFSLSGTASTFTATVSSSGNWLSVNPASGSIPATLSAGISPAGLAAGFYTGTIQIAAPGEATQTVTVSLNVVSPQSLTLTPTSLSFTAVAGGTAPAAQSITVACPNSALSFRPAATSLGNWLSVSVPSVVGNNQIVVAVNPAGLNASTYQGVVTVFGIGGCGTTQTVPVTLTVSAGSGALTSFPSTLAFGAGSLVFSAFTGGGATSQTVAVNCSGSSAAFTTSANSNGGWLSVSPFSGSAPGAVTITANPAGLAAGTYGGSIAANSAACGTAPPLPVTFVVTSNAISSPIVNPGGAVTVSPTSLAFSFQTGGSVPASQPLSLSGSGVAFSVFAPGAGWLSVTPSNGAAPATLSVSVNPAGLAPGFYSAVIVIATNTGTSGTTQSASVALTVSAAPVAVAAINPLSFAYQLGDPSPPPQQVVVSGPPGLALPTAAFSAGGWLSISPANATIPATLIVAVNPSGLTVGSYSGAVTVGAQTVAVTLLVTAPVVTPAAVPVPFISSLVNGASLLGGPIAPGEIVSIYGLGLGPAAGATMQLAPDGTVATSLAGTQVTIGGVPAPVLYTQAGLVGVVVPYSVAGRATVPVLVQYQGVLSAASSFAVTNVSPAIFTDDNSGHGQGAILNFDASANSAANPASRGSIAVIFAEGAGAMNPPSADGVITSLTPAQPLAAVSVLVDGHPAELTYSGDAPEEVSGVLQVNFRIPQQVSAGPAISVVLIVGTGSSQPGVTMAIQ